MCFKKHLFHNCSISRSILSTSTFTNIQLLPLPQDHPLFFIQTSHLFRQNFWEFVQYQSKLLRYSRFIDKKCCSLLLSSLLSLLLTSTRFRSFNRLHLMLITSLPVSVFCILDKTPYMHLVFSYLSISFECSSQIIDILGLAINHHQIKLTQHRSWY